MSVGWGLLLHQVSTETCSQAGRHSAAHMLRFETQLCHSHTVWPWATCETSLGLSFLIWNKERRIIFALTVWLWESVTQYLPNKVVPQFSEHFNSSLQSSGGRKKRGVRKRTSGQASPHWGRGCGELEGWYSAAWLVHTGWTMRNPVNHWSNSEAPFLW